MSNTKQRKDYNIALLVLRSTLFWVWSIANTIVFTLPVLISSAISFKTASCFAAMWQHANLLGLRYICGVSWKADGIENIPDHPCVVLSKHQSTWETYYLPTMVGHSVYVAKRSLIWIPLFGWCIAALKFILIDRSSGRTAMAQMTEQTQQRLTDGISVIIFPEGTRTALGATPNYRIGGAYVAEHTGADVLPVALNSGEFWPRMGYIKWPGEITVSFGPVIKTANKSANDILAETQDWIENRMTEISVVDRFPYRGTQPQTERS